MYCSRAGRSNRLRLALRHSGQTHAFDHPLTAREEVRIVAFSGGLETLDREVGVDGEARFDLLPRIIGLAKMRETSGQIKEGPGIVAVGVDRLSQPARCGFIFTEVSLCRASMKVPKERVRIAGAKAQRFQDMSLSLLRPADENTGQTSRPTLLMTR
jgi:hypothetical protein